MTYMPQLFLMYKYVKSGLRRDEKRGTFLVKQQYLYLLGAHTSNFILALALPLLPEVYKKNCVEQKEYAVEHHRA